MRQGKKCSKSVVVTPFTVAALRFLRCLPVGLLFVAVACTSGRPSIDESEGDGTAAFHDRLLVLDSHAGFTSDPLTTCGQTERQVDIPKMRMGGVDVVFFTPFASQGERSTAGYAAAEAQALEAFRGIHELVVQCGDVLGLARSPEAARSIVDSGRIAAAIGMENGFMIGPDLTLLERYAELGGAYLSLTHDGHNAIADAAIPFPHLGDGPSEHGGVSDFGAEVITELNRLGIMIDVSHLSKDASREAIRLSAVPVIASHSGMDAIAPHPRNMNDETLLLLASKGGVVQIPALHEFIKTDPPGVMEAFYALLDEFGISTDAEARTLPPNQRTAFERRNAEALERWPLATVREFVDHIDHVVDLVGVDHVGIGSDFDGGAGLTGWANASETPNVTAELVRRGYTEEDIAKIWGGNLLRVWADVRTAATGLARRPAS